jgi:hypothetical protein
MMTMMMMTMLGRNASAQNESVASVQQHDDNNLSEHDNENHNTNA